MCEISEQIYIQTSPNFPKLNKLKVQAIVIIQSIKSE